VYISFLFLQGFQEKPETLLITEDGEKYVGGFKTTLYKYGSGRMNLLPDEPLSF
jgi:hypothetical protein